VHDIQARSARHRFTRRCAKACMRNSAIFCGCLPAQVLRGLTAGRAENSLSGKDESSFQKRDARETKAQGRCGTVARSVPACAARRTVLQRRTRSKQCPGHDAPFHNAFHVEGSLNTWAVITRTAVPGGVPTPPRRDNRLGRRPVCDHVQPYRRPIGSYSQRRSSRDAKLPRNAP
jgi:hypothetical protein